MPLDYTLVSAHHLVFVFNHPLQGAQLIPYLVLQNRVLGNEHSSLALVTLKRNGDGIADYTAEKQLARSYDTKKMFTSRQGTTDSPPAVPPMRQLRIELDVFGPHVADFGPSES